MAGNNIQSEFTGKTSIHPVALTTGTHDPAEAAVIQSRHVECVDCHNNNAGPGAGGTGPKGPHGSTWKPLLERQYITTDYTAESAAYALCYKCHNRNNFINSGGSFSYHMKHIVEFRTPCNVCHDPHGVSSTQGNATNNSKLINFDTSVVRATSGGQLKFVSTGPSRGQCHLVCHGKSHNPLSY